MQENNEQSNDSINDQRPETPVSPAEKLEVNPPTGSLIPGAENPESQEVKEEKSPNSE